MGKWIGCVVVVLAGCAADFELTLLRAEDRYGNPVVAEIEQDGDVAVLSLGDSTALDRGLVTMRVAAARCQGFVDGPAMWSCFENDRGYGLARIR